MNSKIENYKRLYSINEKNVIGEKVNFVVIKNIKSVVKQSCIQCMFFEINVFIFFMVFFYYQIYIFCVRIMEVGVQFFISYFVDFFQVFGFDIVNKMFQVVL